MTQATTGGLGASPYKPTTQHSMYLEWSQRFRPHIALAQRILNGDAFYDETMPLRALVVWGKMHGIPAADNWAQILAKRGCG